MRYRLRTLLIVIGLAALPLARMAYLKQMANSHQKEVSKQIHKLAVNGGSHTRAFESQTAYEVQTEVEMLASHDSPLRVGTVAIIDTTVNIFLDAADGPEASCLIVGDEDCVEGYQAATFHQVMANRYDRAVYRPWTIVRQPSLPPESRELSGRQFRLGR